MIHNEGIYFKAEKTPVFVPSARFGVDGVVQKHKGRGYSDFWLLRTGMVVKSAGRILRKSFQNHFVSSERDNLSQVIKPRRAGCVAAAGGGGHRMSKGKGTACRQWSKDKNDAESVPGLSMLQFKYSVFLQRAR